MDRRRFLYAGSALGVAALAGRRGAYAATGSDLVLRRAAIFDGTGKAPFEGDLAIRGDRIVEVGRVSGRGVEEIDLAGLALAPGFIDIHSHADLSLLVNPKAESRIRQGVTLEVVGQDGNSVGPWSEQEAKNRDEYYRRVYGVEIDFRDLGGFLRRLEKDVPAVNLASMVGHGTVRGRVMGGENRPATERELESMKGLVRSAIADGAVGFSSGLEYTPGSFAPTSELVALAAQLAGSGYPYSSHMRNEGDRVLAAIEETLQIGRLAGVPVLVSHLKAMGMRNYWKAPVALELLEKARAEGIDVHYDRYPYAAYATGLQSLFPSWARAGSTSAFLKRLEDPGTAPAIEAYTRDKIAMLGSWNTIQITTTATQANAWAKGGRLGDLAKERGEEPYALTKRLIIEEEAGVGIIGFGMSEENTARLVTHPLGIACSDGGSYAPYGPLSSGRPHPRVYGTYPRILGRYVREQGLLSLEEAIHKCTEMPAKKLRIEGRGVIRVGAFADLVAFDPETVSDRATFTDPHRYPVGIPLVIVNGTVTIRDGDHTGSLAGRPVRGRGAPSPGASPGGG